RRQERQRAGKRVGRGAGAVNGARALVSAGVGVAIGAGTDVAVEAGDIVLVRSDPRDVPRIVRLSRASYRKMVQNLWWATGYNVVAIPLAAGVLARYGILLSPAIGAVLMSLSTVIVAVNAQLLRRARIGSPPLTACQQCLRRSLQLARLRPHERIGQERQHVEVRGLGRVLLRLRRVALPLIRQRGEVKDLRVLLVALAELVDRGVELLLLERDHSLELMS